MSNEFPFIIYYLVLFVAIIFLSRFIFTKYIQFSRKFNLTKKINTRADYKVLVVNGAGVVYASVIMVAALTLDNLDFVKFSNFSPLLATAILLAILGFYNDFVEISKFSKYILITFLILMLLYSNATIPIIQNLNGFLDIYEIGYLAGLIFTYAIYLSIMYAINLVNGINGYLAIFSIFFFVSLFFHFDINEFYTLNSVSAILIGCSFIFLRYSFSKDKKLFLGNAGSLFIGFWIATFVIIYITTTPTSRLVDMYAINIDNIPIIAISMISIPMLDSLRFILKRVLEKKLSYTTHRNNLHHILIDRGMSHFRTSLFLTCTNWFNCLVIFLIEPNFNSKELLLIYLLIIIAWYIFFEFMNRNNISS